MLSKWVKENSPIWVDKYNIKATITLKDGCIMISFEYKGKDVNLMSDLVNPEDDPAILKRLIDGEILYTGIEWDIEDYVEEQMFQEDCYNLLKDKGGI